MDFPDKWKNYPAPPLSQSVLDALKIGGLIPNGCGEFSGQPLFRLEWGMTATKFANGNCRLRYPARSRRIQRYYGLRRDFAESVMKFVKDDAQRQYDAYMRLDLSESYKITEATPFIVAHGIEGVDYEVLDANLPPRDLAVRCALRDFVFFSDIALFEQIGKPFWFLTRWMPTPRQQATVAKGYGTMLDTEAGWMSQRFTEGHCPETGDRRVLDCLGPYPQDGGYLADFFCFETMEPLTASMLEKVISHYVSARNELTERYKTDKEFRTQQELNQELEEFDAESFLWETTFEEMFWDAIPAFDRLGMVTKGKTVKTI